MHVNGLFEEISKIKIKIIEKCRECDGDVQAQRRCCMSCKDQLGCNSRKDAVLLQRNLHQASLRAACALFAIVIINGPLGIGKTSAAYMSLLSRFGANEITSVILRTIIST